MRLRKCYLKSYLKGLGILFLNSTLMTSAVLAESGDRIHTTGSSTVAPLVAELAHGFETKTPGLRIEVEMGGSSRGVADALAGTVDFGMASRTLKPEEQSSGLTAVTIAWDGIAMIIHRSNPISALSTDQIKAIYTGSITNWKDVGGIDAPIVVVNKAQGRSTLELFLEHFKLKAEQIKASTIIGDNQQGIKLVGSNPSAIGYVSVGAAEYEAKNGGSLKLLPLEGVVASTENIRNRSYPLVRPLNLVIKSELSNVAKNFVDYMLSKDANSVIEELYFVPLHG